MAQRRFIVEIGMGTDLHGRDVTKAAAKAVKDAVSRSCLCGLMEIVSLKDPAHMHVAIKVGCPYPEAIREQEVLAALPLGSATLEVVPGCLSVRGLSIPELGEGDTIVVAVAALTVFIEMGE